MRKVGEQSKMMWWDETRLYLSYNGTRQSTEKQGVKKKINILLHWRSLFGSHFDCSNKCALEMNSKPFYVWAQCNWEKEGITQLSSQSSHYFCSFKNCSWSVNTVVNTFCLILFKSIMVLTSEKKRLVLMSKSFWTWMDTVLQCTCIYLMSVGMNEPW